MAVPERRRGTTISRLLFALLFVCFAGAIIGDSTAEALLLAHFDVDVLPRLFLINAVVLFFASAFIMSLIDRFDRGKFFLFVALGHGAVLLLVRLALLFDATFIFVPLFTYAYIAKILLFLLFWTLANDLIDSRSAQKVFPRVAAGGTLGAIAVAFAIPGLVTMFSAENLLLLWALCSIVLGLLVVPLRRNAGHSFAPSSDVQRHSRRSLSSTVADMRMIHKDPLLSTMALLYGILFFALITQHYFFYAEVKRHFASPEGIAGFLGLFNGLSMTAAVLLQVSVAGALLRKFGSSRAMLCLPVALLLVFSALFVLGLAHPVGSAVLFVSLVLAMGLRMAFLDAFFSPNFQVFFSSLPREVRGRAKLTLEGVVKPAAILAASVWLFLSAEYFSFAVNMAVLAMAALALVLTALRLRKKYAESLTHFLAGLRGKGGLASLAGDSGVRTTDFIGLVGSILFKGEFEVQKFLIEELSSSPSAEFVGLLTENLDHPDPRVRATIVSALGRLGRADHLDLLAARLEDEDHRVVANAISALGAFASAAAVPLLEPFLGHSNGRVRSNAAIALWRNPHFSDKEAALRPISPLLDLENRHDCACALFALGEIDAPQTLAILSSFVDSCDRVGLAESREVHDQLVLALGKKPVPKALDLLLGLGRGASGLCRASVVDGLALLLERGIPFETVAGRIRKGDGGDRHLLVQALQRSGGIPPQRLSSLLEETVAEEIEAVRLDRESLATIEAHRHLSGVDLLGFAIREEKIALRIETMIHAIAALDKSGSIGTVLPRLSHADRHVRGRALEVLDNSGDVTLNRMVMEILEERPAAEVATRHPESLPEVVERYVLDVNEWVRLCAGFAAAQVESSILLDTRKASPARGA